MISRIIPAIIRMSPNRKKPSAFHASLLNISDGPTIFLPEIASAVAERSAAPLLARFIPPEPRKSNAPKMMKQIPSRNAASDGEKGEFEEKIHRLTI